MHVYYFVPKTLEITHVDSYFFRDLGACEHSVDAALTVATRRAQHGDLVDADCISIDLVADTVPGRDDDRVKPGVVEL